MEYEQLKLENQICFPLYAASRLITRAYKPLLEDLELTYPQYLVLIVLWEDEELTVNTIAKKLLLNTNTLTPLLKRMQNNGLILRQRSERDEREVIISLTAEGRELRHRAAAVPQQLAEGFSDNGISADEINSMKKTLLKIIGLMK